MRHPSARWLLIAGALIVVVAILIVMRSDSSPSIATLDDMRESADFQPPQSYRYVDRDALGSLVNGHPAGPTLLSLLHH